MASYISSSIGKKQLMAITGLGWCAFVLSHMLGNLLTLISAESYNSYGDKIVSNPLLPIAEIGLVLMLTGHIVFAILTSLENRKARGSKYAISPSGKGGTSAASKTMAYTGTLILVFIVLHLITFKYGPHYPVQYSGAEIRDLYQLMAEVFAQPVYVGWYLFSMVVLCMHLQHALASSVNTFGFVGGKKLQCLSWGFGLIVALGFAINPIFFFLKR